MHECIIYMPPFKHSFENIKFQMYFAYFKSDELE